MLKSTFVIPCLRKEEGKSSRQTVLNDINQLEEDEIIYYMTQKENSRDHNFYVKGDNIVVSVSKELDEFDKLPDAMP